MIKQFFKDTPNSVFFWNGLALLTFIILCSMGEQVVLSTMCLISIPAVFMIVINWEDSKYDDNVKIVGYHWWAYLAPVTWVLIVVGLVLGPSLMHTEQSYRQLNKVLIITCGEKLTQKKHLLKCLLKPLVVNNQQKQYKRKPMLSVVVSVKRNYVRTVIY